MKKIYRLKSNLQYKQVYKKGKAVSNDYFTLIYVKNTLATSITPKFGFNISGKYGKAVKRNKLRRQLKSICAEKALFVQSGTYVLRPRFYFQQAPEFCVLKKSVIELIDQTQK